jgi:CRP-like cAMP-binding protein
MKKNKTLSAINEVHESAPLVDFIQNMYPLRAEIIAYIHEHTFLKKIRLGKYLLKPGEACSHYYYIHKGILRSFVKYGNKEITTWINPENEITTSIRSMSQRQTSHEYIQALTDCELIAMPFDAMDQLYVRFPEMNMVGRVLLEEYYAGAEERAFISRIPNAATRYKHFMESRPELINRLPLKYIASYLGMTVETLSRLRSRKKL